MRFIGQGAVTEDMQFFQFLCRSRFSAKPESLATAAFSRLRSVDVPTINPLYKPFIPLNSIKKES